ncbi:MAG TPA: hypothetical protein VKV74_13370 [Bryobacteraceae bacterium]|nr:hypothetical protein [Bryobacteraceae bacterium]
MNAVACPYFLPQCELPDGLWVHEPRWPLGKAFSGLCYSRASEPLEPPGQHQEELCNYGYARGRCERFPPGSTTDAVRFSIIEKDALRLRIVYVVEKEHVPARFGTLDYGIHAGAVSHPGPDAVLTRQAEAFAKSYLARIRTAFAGNSDTVL